MATNRILCSGTSLYILFAGWRKTEGKTFSSNIVSALQQHNAEDFLECQALCDQNSACVAITYNENSPSNTNDCILRSRTKDELSSEDDFIDSTADYYDHEGKAINSINISHFSSRSKYGIFLTGANCLCHHWNCLEPH